jgi:hypothetical protein
MFANPKYQMIYETFVSSHESHLEFIRHIEMLFLKIHIFFFMIYYQNKSLDQL